MGSAHKKTSRVSAKIDLLSEESEFMNSKIFTIAFGGLHLSKAVINCCRNHVLTFEGENFGLYILRMYKDECTILNNIKNAVFVGKDRQYDYLSYITTCSIVQDFLKILKFYKVVRIPELILRHTENAKTQKSIILPTPIATNTNGDVVILDSAASCLHVIDRSTVAKCYTVGSYLKPSTTK